ncbi:MAG: hypothetical protein A2W22_05650 [Candidatus Levybacteria bacterium RBG_16_35_11]|nr:MAG: hypothetical protein A2W22_05650 [Candidatus Levybacteria bacterium RBG_16_35_11]
MDEFPSHFDSLYPESSRFEEIEKILSFIKEGKSVQLISVPGGGRSNLFGFLAYNHKIRRKHLGENQKWFHFVYLNLFEIKNRNFFDFLKFLFLSLADSLKERQMISEHDKLHRIFKDHLGFNDEVVLFQGLKEAIDFLAIEKELTIIFLFDQFETYIPSVSPLFFENLRILRNRAKYRFSSVFSLTRPIDSLIDESTLAPFSEFLEDNQIYLKLKDESGLDFRLSYLEKITGKKLNKELVNEIIALTGGQGRLTKLGEEIAISENISSEISIKDFSRVLLSKKAVDQALLEIWDSLTPSEQRMLIKKEKNDYLEKIGLLENGKITIRLFEAFIKDRNKRAESEKFYFDKNSKEIKKGEHIISDKLTSLEFKLLKFLIENKNKLAEREEIIKAVWTEAQSTAGVTDQAVDQLISRLRKKIEEDSNNPVFLQTIKGRGIKFSN